jgi:uncharacterized membrane protein YraQ (UPF0718 family)
MLTDKRVFGFSGFALLSYIAGIVWLVIPLSVWAVRADPSGSGSGYFIALLIVVAPIVATPGAVISGVLALWITDRALNAASRSRADYVAFLIAAVLSIILGIVVTYATAWAGALILRSIEIPAV